MQFASALRHPSHVSVLAAAEAADKEGYWSAGHGGATGH